MKNPFDVFNKQTREASKKVDPHLDLWKTWNENGRKEEHLEPLLDAMEPSIKRHAQSVYKGLGGSTPYGAVEAQARIAAKSGLDSYKPDQGAKVRTWVISNFPRMTDFVAKTRNFANIPKPRMDLVGRFQNAKNEFMTTHGHEPTLKDMVDALPEIPEHTLKPLMTEIRRELYIGGNPNPDADDGSMGHAPSQLRTIISLMPALLTGEEKKVLDALFPANGTTKTITQIAREAKMTENNVYRLRASIYEKVKPHLGNV